MTTFFSKWTLRTSKPATSVNPASTTKTSGGTIIRAFGKDEEFKALGKPVGYGLSKHLNVTVFLEELTVTVLLELLTETVLLKLHTETATVLGLATMTILTEAFTMTVLLELLAEIEATMTVLDGGLSYRGRPPSRPW